MSMKLQRFVNRCKSQIGWYLILLLLSVIAVFPLFYLYSSALRTFDELFERPPRLWPKHITFEFFEKVLKFTPFLTFTKNSVIVALSSTFISVTIGCMAAYSITRFAYRGRGFISRAVLIAYMFPPIILVIPLFQIIAGLGLVNTYLGLIITYITFSFPFSTWLLTSYFKTIPKEIEEAAIIDGASNFAIFHRIILPLSSPAIVTAAIFTFINAWNEFLYAVVIASAKHVKTLPVGLYGMVGGEMMEWGPVLAWAAMIVLPSLLFFLIISKQIVSGLTAGAVKG